MEQLQANIYALSDKAVVYSENIYGEDRAIYKSILESDHTFLDDFYHELQERNVMLGGQAKRGTELFEMSEIEEASDCSCDEIIQDMYDGYEYLKEELISLIKDVEEIDLQNDLIDFLKGVRQKCNEYGKYLMKEVD